MIDVDLTSLGILVVDDQDFMRDLIKTMLKQLGVRRIVDVENGAKGLAVLANEDHELDLIICDLDMPVMNGFDFVKRLRQDFAPPTSNLPVLILTGNRDVETVKEMADLGIEGYVLKPVAKDRLKSHIIAAFQPRDASRER